MSDNYYVLLELDPAVDDWAIIEGAIKAHHRSWALQKNQGSPVARRNADRCLALLPDIEAALRDPARRKAMADAARKENADKKKNVLAKVDDLIAMILEPSISPDEVKLLVKQAGDGITEAEVIARLKARGKLVESRRAAPTTRPKLDRTIAGEIRDNLRHIKKASLYDFLGLNPRSSPRMLHDAADEIYKELRRKGLTDADSTARQALAGHCKAVFRGPAEKEQYDNSYASEAMESLTGHLEIAGRDAFLDQAELDVLLREARVKGVAQDVALEFIADYAQKRKWSIQKSKDLPSSGLKLCGFCNSIARTPRDTRCHQCGQELVQPCPRCAQPTPTQDECCGACGASTGDAPVVHGLLREAKEHLARNEFIDAITCLDRALVYWDNWPPTLELRRNVEAARLALENALGAVETSVRANRLQEARTLLDRLKRDFRTVATKELERRIESGIQRTSDSFRAAEAFRLAGRGEDAVEKYMEALDFCADFQPALRALATSPPPSPTALQISLGGANASLQWQGVNARGAITYRVQRKAGGTPMGPQDGTTVCEVPSRACDDAGFASGTPWYYAVYAMRGGVASTSAAVSGPHLRAADPTGVAVDPGNGQVTISWTPPPGCQAVEVWRSDGAIPVRAGAGTRIPSAERSAVDAGVCNDATYGYLIVAAYSDPRDGRSVIRSPGIGRLAIPIAPPPPVEDLVVKRQDRNAVLTWTPPARGTVEIRQSQRLPATTPGLMISIANADQFGVPIPISGTGSAHVTLTGQGRLYFVPLSVVAQTAVVGRPAAVTTLDDVTAIETRREGDTIHLTWQWPAGALEALITWRHDAFPSSPNEPLDGSRPVTKREYDRSGLWELCKAARSRHYFTIFVRDPEADIYSTGSRVLEGSGLEAKVTYRVVVRRHLLRGTVREAWVELRAEEVWMLPPLQVVLKPSMPPLRPDDGRVIEKLNRLEFANGVARIALPSNGPTGFVKLFFQNGQHAKEIRLLPAAADELRLG